MLCFAPVEDGRHAQEKPRLEVHSGRRGDPPNAAARRSDERIAKDCQADPPESPQIIANRAIGGLLHICV